MLTIFHLAEQFLAMYRDQMTRNHSWLAPQIFSFPHPTGEVAVESH